MKIKTVPLTFMLILFLSAIAGIEISFSDNTDPTIEPRFTVNQLWKYATYGIVYPPPIVADGHMYTVSFSAYSSFVEVNCLNASTGALIWNYGPRGFAGSLAVSDGYVYTSSTWGDLEAFNASTGTKV